MKIYLHDFVNDYFNLETKNLVCWKKEVDILQEMEILNKHYRK